LIYMRATHADQLPPLDVYQGRLWTVFGPFAKKVVTNKLKNKADHQGIGRQNAADVWADGKEDLRAISAYLGAKEYLAGEQPNKLDATAFAHLCQFYYAPTDNEMKTYMKEEQCTNLVDYMERMKNRYWSDWNENLRKPTPPKEPKMKKSKTTDQAVVSTEQQTVENGNENNKESIEQINGCPIENEKSNENEEKIDGCVQSTTKIELIKVTPITEDEKIVAVSAAFENGVNEENMNKNISNGCTTATVEKTAE